MNIQEENKLKNEVRTRPPIVVVMGHVDHGKSSLLEAIREEFRITSTESGGITQHIGAYRAEFQDKEITFIDTPGHEAFSAMRSRGARVADIAILVVAADDSVKPQTKEALEQIKNATIPFIVAITKIDKPEANEEKVKSDLLQEGIQVESYGGTIPSVAVSAVSKQGIPELLEMILLVAELENLQVDGLSPGKGVIIESAIDSKRGTAATVIVQEGVFRTGDIIGTPSTVGKIRILEDSQRNAVQEAGPSMPVALVGLEHFPRVGEEVRVFFTKEEAQAALVAEAPVEGTVVGRSSEVETAETTVSLIIKADVAGSLEALLESLEKIPQETVSLQIVKAEVGEIGENDVRLAQSAHALVVGFRSRMAQGVAELAERTGVVVNTFQIIYEVIESLRKIMEQAVGPEVVRNEQGDLEVLAVFNKEKGAQVVGGRVKTGELRKGAIVDIMRGEEQIGTGKIRNIQHNKEDVAMVAEGQETGLLIESPIALLQGDRLVAYTNEKRSFKL